MTAITTDRLILRLGEPADAEAMVRYLEANRLHLEPFEPARSPVDFTADFWVEQFEKRRAEYQADRSMRLLIFGRSQPKEILGTIALSNFVRAAKQSCTLGYGLAENKQGKGLMTEAVAAIVEFGFKQLGFHKIEAGYMPHNVRSALVLKRLGFVVEGYARDHVRINGRWEDHVLTAIINPNWVESRSAPESNIPMANIQVEPIGWVRCCRTEPIDDNWGKVESEIVLDSALCGSEALAGLGDFSHIEVVYQFNKVDPERIERGSRRPRGRQDWSEVGIFAQRGKARPNRLGVSRCRLLDIAGLTLRVEGLDAIDGTPVLDIKPYMAEFGPIGEVRQPAWSSEIMAKYNSE